MKSLDTALITTATFLGDFANGSEEWHNARNEAGAIGGSDIGTIAGWNRWESAITKWAKKSGLIEDKIEPSHRMRMGTKFEDDLLEIYAEDHPGEQVFSTGTWAQVSQPLNRANPDAIAIDENGELLLIEVKFAGDNMYQIPPSYRAQMQWYMGILGIKRGVLVACAGSNYVELPIEFDAFEFDTLLLLADQFRRYLESGTMPDWDGSNSTYETMRAINPDINPDEIEELGDLGIHLTNAYAELQASETKYRELQSRTLEAMGQAKWGTVDDKKIVYRTSRGNGQPYLAWVKGK